GGCFTRPLHFPPFEGLLRGGGTGDTGREKTLTGSRSRLRLQGETVSLGAVSPLFLLDRRLTLPRSGRLGAGRERRRAQATSGRPRRRGGGRDARRGARRLSEVVPEGRRTPHDRRERRRVRPAPDVGQPERRQAGAGDDRDPQ